jgi:hypothetical protein
MEAHKPEALFSSPERWDTFENAQLVNGCGMASQGALHASPSTTRGRIIRDGTAEAGLGPRQLGRDTLGFLPLAE